MKDEEVPQDDANMLQGKFKKLYYATDMSEHYTQVGSVGWEPENVMLQLAWEEIHQKIEEARQKVIKGEASLLYYYMQKNQMNPAILAGYVGLPSFLVKLHLRPFFYNMIGTKRMEKYAFAFNIKVEEMVDRNNVLSLSRRRGERA